MDPGFGLKISGSSVTHAEFILSASTGSILAPLHHIPGATESELPPLKNGIQNE